MRRAVSKLVDWQDGASALAERLAHGGLTGQWVDRANIDNAVGNAVDKAVDEGVVWWGGSRGG
jgi:hypothetical protein